MAEKKSINGVIAENLAAAMHQHKKLKTQDALAKKAGLAQRTVGYYLDPSKRKAGASGKEPSAKLTELAKMADALGVGVWALVREMTPSQRAYYRHMEEAYAELVASDPDGFTGNTGSDTLP